MNVVVTGADGFVGKNLCLKLSELGFSNIAKITRDTSKQEIQTYLEHADFVYHLAGVNRPQQDSEFEEGNSTFTQFITYELAKNGKRTPIVLSSSTHVERDNAYGRSKLAAEKHVTEYGEKTGASYFIYRLTNVFGKWSRPNYNSAVATFCYNIANNLDIVVNDPSAPLTLVYIDDVCQEMASLIGSECDSGFQAVHPEYPTTVGEVAELLKNFKRSRETLVVEHVGQGLPRVLYATYLSFLEPQNFSYDIKHYEDERGLFCEFLKTKESGQISFFTAHKGVVRGGHYHHTKNEKFLVVKGKALFRFKHRLTGEYYELAVDARQGQVVETVPGWSHDVVNLDEEELIVMLWANEIFDRDNPDTIMDKL
ncbi:UDP-2-acetamido-2,6-beta-L-arabino-hexul-4-ose reductase [Vibrio coralliilyticus]|uniref:UDP-2-acetamido-2,6-beta-L-arabino-hexul-4-ose reductase n=1 Tax=Vibrio coralliilyticus TaxID=190893 RepID=UPI000317757D|nr:NAD-dependent epimerase/dehydratase family protein [Vibrio coralliilyticus]